MKIYTVRLGGTATIGGTATTRQVEIQQNDLLEIGIDFENGQRIMIEPKDGYIVIRENENSHLRLEPLSSNQVAVIPVFRENWSRQ